MPENPTTAHEEKIALLKRKLMLVNASLSNAANQIKGGKVVTASIIDDLAEQQSSLQKQIKHLESSPEAEPPASSSQPAPSAAIPEGAGTPSGDEDDFGIPARLRINRRPYTMTPAALKQRQDAANSQAKAEAMIGNQNAWKTGEHAQGFIRRIFRPCKSTCARYPCNLIDEKSTEVGEMCLDKEEFARSLSAMQKAVKEGRADDIKDLAALRITGIWEVVRMLTEDILVDNSVVKSEKIDKEGNVIGYEIKPHPSLLALGKLVEAAGLAAPEWMVTPREIARQKTERKKARTMVDIMSNLGLATPETTVASEEDNDI